MARRPNPHVAGIRVPAGVSKLHVVDAASCGVFCAHPASARGLPVMSLLDGWELHDRAKLFEADFVFVGGQGALREGLFLVHGSPAARRQSRGIHGGAGA